MFHIKTMTSNDFQFAVHLTDKMNWKMADEDFEFMLKLEPQGCFVLFSNSERVGIVTTISFGRTGWFGNLIVAEPHRRRGAGTLLAKTAVEYLTRENVKTIGLYAYVDKIPFYRKLGFEYNSEFTVLKGKSFASPITADVNEAEKKDVKNIINFDKNCFGASRKKLLEPILINPDNRCHIAIEDGQMIGYAVAKAYDDMAELGPLVCRRGRSNVAISLLKANLSRLKGLEVSMCVQKKESTIIDMLAKSGFIEDFRVARMFYKPRIVKDCIYMAESLERG